MLDNENFLKIIFKEKEKLIPMKHTLKEIEQEFIQVFSKYT